MCWWSCGSDYRGLKKRIKVIQRAEGGTGGYANPSSESDPDPSPSGSGATAHVSDEQEIADEGHDADDETNIHSERRRQTAADGRDDQIELRELKRTEDHHGRVDIASPRLPPARIQ